MTSPATAQAQAVIKAPTPRVFYLAMDDLYESQIAKAWAREHNKTGALVFKVPLERLTMEMVIVPVVRQAETRTPMLQEEWSQAEQRMKSHRLKPEELTGEMSECKPVRVSDFWRSSSGQRGSDAFSELLMGQLDKNGFIDAVNASTCVRSVYPRTHHGDGDTVMRITWGS